MKKNADAIFLLEEKNMSVTKGRLAVLDVLLKTKGPISIDTLKKAVGTNANYVTLYRVLKQLVKSGLVYQTDFRQGKAFYEYQTHHHHHITCSICGEREEVATCISDTIVKRANAGSKKFKSITSHSLEFFGICTKCA